MRSGAIAAMLASGCVYPAPEPTGLELSWRFFEGNAVDGESALRVRSCEGVGIHAMNVRITDVDDEARSRQFRFPCEQGHQTIARFQTEASDAFVQLDPGTYLVAMDAIVDGSAEPIEERELEVNRRGVTVEPWLVTPATIDWTLSLHGVDACESIAISIFYADVAAMLPEHVAEGEDDDDPPPLRYREKLVTDRGLTLGGQSQPCGEDRLGTHVVSSVDRGAYLVEVVVDGRVCSLDVALSAASTATTIDLATLACDA